MGHHDRAADQDEQHERAVRKPCCHLPQLAHPALSSDVWSREEGVAHQVEHRVERCGDDVAEPAVDRGLDVAGDVEQAGRGLLASGQRPVAPRRRRGGRRRADLYRLR